MRDRSARRRERLASNAGIAEQVQKGGIGRVRNPFAQPVPYRRHIGKKAQMPERRATCRKARLRSEEHTSELQSLMRISYAVFCLKKKNINKHQDTHKPQTRHN